MTGPDRRTADPSITELMTQLSLQTSRLVRDELRLAQKEFSTAAKHAGVGAGLFSGAGLLAVFGLGALITSAIAALALVLAVWAAALIVAAMLFATAGIAALVAKKQAAQASPLPDRTVANVKQDIDQVKESRHAQ